MKTIGLIGGMSWQSTAVYYQQLNSGVSQRLGGLHSAQLLLWSVEFAEMERLQAAGDWRALTRHMIQIAQKLETAGAGLMVICSNTMHKMAAEVQAAIDIPLVHIVDATGQALQRSGVTQPLLLATRYTMEEDFYTRRLFEAYGIKAVVPDASGRTRVHDIIYSELCKGVISDRSRQTYLKEISATGCDGVIFGCTEVGLLISQADVSLPCFDSCALHVAAILDLALEGSLGG